MTLKNSFLTDIMENFKRRNWVFWGSFILFFCYFSGVLLLNLNRMKNAYEKENQPELMMERMLEGTRFLFDVNPVVPFIVVFLAIVIGIQGFHYLYDKKQVNFYHSQPVKRSRRFLVLWLNGILIFAFTYLINMLLGAMVAAAYGCFSGQIFYLGIKAFALYFIFFLSLYHLTIIAAMLTGNTLVTTMAMVVFLGYEIAFRTLITLYKSRFFMTYDSNRYSSHEMLHTLFSPVVSLYRYFQERAAYLPWAQSGYGYGQLTATLLFLTLLFGVIGFVLYEKRPSESYGKSIAFSVIKEPLRFLLLLLVGICAGLLFYVAAGQSVVFAVLGTGFVIFLGHAVIQMIYEVDFRAILRKLSTVAVTFVAAVLFFAVFKYDLTDFDNRIPKQQKVESVGLRFITDRSNGIQWVLPDGNELWGTDYSENMMRLTNLEPVYELLENVENAKEIGEDAEKEYHTLHAKFYLKNGDVDHRIFYLAYEENLELINEIYHMEEYLAVTRQMFQDNFMEDFNIVRALYHNGVEGVSLNSRETMEKLLEAYERDVAEAHYRDIYYDIPVGNITLEGQGIKNTWYSNRWEMAVYPTYHHTIALLKELSIDWKADFDEEYISQVKRITVTFTDHEAWEEADYNAEYDYEKEVVYENREAIKKILGKAIPYANTSWTSAPISYANQYDVVAVKIATEEEQGEGYANRYANVSETEGVIFVNFKLKEGDMPDFILQDLDKIEYGDSTVIK